MSASESNIPDVEGRVGKDGKQKNITVRDKRRRLSGENYDELTAFKMEMRSMLESFQETQIKKIDTLAKDIQEVKAQTSNINITNQDIEKSLDFMAGQLENLQTKIDGLETQRKEVLFQVAKVKEKCELLEKSLRKTCIEIKYIPRIENENKDTLFSYIENLAKTLDINMQSSDLRDLYRIPNRKDPSKSTVVMELSNTLMKHKFLSSARKINRTSKLNMSHLGIRNNTTPLFLSESLTANSRRLYFLTREFAKQEKYQFCWTSNGNIYIKKQEGSPYILVKNESQLCSANPQ